MGLQGKKAILHNMCPRRGMHPKLHQIWVEEMVDMALPMDEFGIRVAEVSHSDSLGGASIDYGSPDATDQAYLGAV